MAEFRQSIPCLDRVAAPQGLAKESGLTRKFTGGLTGKKRIGSLCDLPSARRDGLTATAQLA